MQDNKKKLQFIAGIGILVVVVVVGFIIFSLIGGNKDVQKLDDGTKIIVNDDGSKAVIDKQGKEHKVEVIKGLIGSEKSGFLNNQRVKDILLGEYFIELDWDKAGSYEMQDRDEGMDFLWPSSQVALELYKMKPNNRRKKDEIIFNSPIVLYSWEEVVDILIDNGIIKMRENTYYVVDMQKLIDLIYQEKTWSDIGLDLLGDKKKIKVISTDPLKSNSGNMFAGLLANILNNSNVVNKSTAGQIVPKVVEYFARLGFQIHSTGTLFEQEYLNKGIGAYPVIVGYESLIVEFSQEHPNAVDMVKIVYPEPTVWSSHPLIALNEKGEKLIEAMADEELMSIAWSQHGFRKGMVDLDAINYKGIPQRVTKIVDMPSAEVMKKIMSEIEENRKIGQRTGENNQ